MNIEIHRPELEALIHERMETGQFENIEDALTAALKSSAEEDAIAAPERPKESLEQMFLRVRGLFEDGELDFSRDRSPDRPVDLS